MAQTGFTPILLYSSSTGGNSPSASNLTNSTLGSELAINITDGKLFYKDNANAIQVIGWKTVPTTAGGTGLTSYTAGDLLYYATGTALSKLAIGANDTVLTSSGSAPQWSTGLNLTTASTIVVNDNTNPALRLTQTGTGNAFVVEDDTSPDATPFVIDAAGRAIIGTTASTLSVGNAEFNLQVVGTTVASSGAAFSRYQNSQTAAPSLRFGKSRSATIGSQAIVVSNDTLSIVDFAGSDGVNFISSARISAFVDGTPGVNDMPGRLVFSTTADGASATTDRMTINSAGRVLINTATARIFDSGTSTATPYFQLEGTDGSTASIGVVRNSASLNAGNLFLAKTRSATNGGVTVVQDGDQLGVINFQGADGTNLIEAAIVRAEVDGVPATNDMPGRLIFLTTTAGSSTPTEKARLTNAGYLGVLNNNPACALDVTGGIQTSRTGVTAPAATDGNIYSGTYTPTLTNTTNVGSSSASVAQYMRVGNVVTVSGQVDIDPTATGDTVMGVSLPIASNLTSQAQAAGTFISLSGVTFQGGSIYGDGTNDRATFRFAASSTANFAFQYHFTYRVI